MTKSQILLISMATTLIACGGRDNSSSGGAAPDSPIAALPQSVVTPVDNPQSQAKINLGKALFWDPVLSGSQDVACATCHHPDNGYAEQLDLSIGVGGQGLSEDRKFGALIKRNAPTIINTAFNGINQNNQYEPSNTVMFWDNRAASLEQQALEPIKSDVEMRGTDISEAEILNVIVNRLQAIPDYVVLFSEAFGEAGTETISPNRIAKAIAAFQRSIISVNSPFDRYIRGETTALTAQQINGMNEFEEAGCDVCHGGPMLSDFELHQLPVEHNNKLAELDNGVDGQFRTPTLRNVALTAPYMHNGTIATLEEAIEFYHNIDNPANDPDLEQLDQSDSERIIADMAAFLRALSDESFDRTVPNTVPSGLNPGGDI